jgi:cytochrome-b5 reductase
VVRAYTPVSSDDDVGIFELVVKVYRPLEPQFPNGGLLSQYLGDMKVGDSVDVRGPTGHIEYAAPGTLRLWNKLKKKEAPRTVKVKHLAMMAGGTGITPMLQVRLERSERSTRNRRGMSAQAGRSAPCSHFSHF